MTPIPLGNKNSLMIVDKPQWFGAPSKLTPHIGVALVSLWDQGQSGCQLLRPLVEELIGIGCKYVVCAGSDSERLHDFVDSLILDTSLSIQSEYSDEIMTTWHDTDTDDEVASFFLHAISMSVSNTLFVAFLDDHNPQDARLKAAILDVAVNG